MEIKKNVAFIANSCSRLPIKAYLFIHSPVATRKQPGEEKKKDQRPEFYDPRFVFVGSLMSQVVGAMIGWLPN